MSSTFHPTPPPRSTPSNTRQLFQAQFMLLCPVLMIFAYPPRAIHSIRLATTSILSTSDSLRKCLPCQTSQTFLARLQPSSLANVASAIFLQKPPSPFCKPSREILCHHQHL